MKVEFSHEIRIRQPNSNLGAPKLTLKVEFGQIWSNLFEFDPEKLWTGLKQLFLLPKCHLIYDVYLTT